MDIAISFRCFPDLWFSFRAPTTTRKAFLNFQPQKFFSTAAWRNKFLNWPPCWTCEVCFTRSVKDLQRIKIFYARTSVLWTRKWLSIREMFATNFFYIGGRCNNVREVFGGMRCCGQLSLFRGEKAFLEIASWKGGLEQTPEHTFTPKVETDC